MSGQKKPIIWRDEYSNHLVGQVLGKDGEYIGLVSKHAFDLLKVASSVILERELDDIELSSLMTALFHLRWKGMYTNHNTSKRGKMLLHWLYDVLGHDIFTSGNVLEINGGNRKIFYFGKPIDMKYVESYYYKNFDKMEMENIFYGFKPYMVDEDDEKLKLEMVDGVKFHANDGCWEGLASYIQEHVDNTPRGSLLSYTKIEQVKEDYISTYDQVIFWDMETFCGDDKPFQTPYAISAACFNVDDLNAVVERYQAGNMRDCDVEAHLKKAITPFSDGVLLFEGIECCTKFLDWVLSRAGANDGSYRKPNITCISFNGDSFDNKVLLHATSTKLTNGATWSVAKNFKELMLKIDDVCGGEKYVRFADVLSFTGTLSLRKACEKYGVPDSISKGKFAFSKIKNWRDVQIWEEEWGKYVNNDVLSLAWMTSVFENKLKYIQLELLDCKGEISSVYDHNRLGMSDMSKLFTDFPHVTYTRELEEGSCGIVKDVGKRCIFEGGNKAPLIPFEFMSISELPSWVVDLYPVTKVLEQGGIQLLLPVSSK